MSDSHPRRWPKVLGGIVLVLVVLVVAGLFALDRILLSQARKQADSLSAELGRPVTIGEIQTRFLGGFGVRVTGVEIGAAPDEGVPLVALHRAEVRVGLLRAIVSLGKDILVREAVLEGLRVNLVKLPDGTTNAERVSKKLAREKAAEEEKPAPAAKPTAFRSFRVDHAGIENARIAFIDRSRPGAKELFVDDLDVEVKDLEIGKPLELSVRAAVLAQAQNLDFRVKAAPLPATLSPTIEEVTLKVQPIDLDPLAPFLPPSAGFQGGRFEADLSAKLGAAVPGGAGKTTARGGFKATRLAFAGQEGGRRLDASLAMDVEADAATGDLRIGKLDFTAGPVVVTGRGSASGLKGDQPKFNELEIVARGLDPEALAAYYPPLRKQLAPNVVAGPVGLSLRGSGTQAAQTAELRVDLTPVRLVVPKQLTKAAGAPMTFVAHVQAAQGGDRAKFDAALDLAGADLRPGESLAKKPGDPMSFRANGTYRKTAGGQEIRVDGLDAVLLADRLTGKASADLAGTGAKKTTKFTADVRGDRLDLDRLLLPTPTPAAGRIAAKPASKPLDPALFAGVSGTASLELGTLRMKKMDMRNVVVRMRVQNDEVTFDEARLQAFGGTVSAAGTKLAVAHPDAPFQVAVNLKGVAGDQALNLVSDHRVLGGTLDAAVKLGGTGWKVGFLQKSVTGGIQGNLRDGAFYGKDLVASVAAPIAAKLPFAASKLPQKGSTSLGKDLPFAFNIANGVASLAKPIKVDTGDGQLAFEGGVRLDGSLEMPVTFGLAPDLVARMTGGRAKPTAPIPVAFRLAGPAWSPRLDGLDVGGAVKAIAQQAAAGAVGRALGVQGSSVQDVAGQKKAQAEAKAKEEADKRKKQLEEEAQKRLKGLFGR